MYDIKMIFLLMICLISVIFPHHVYTQQESINSINKPRVKLLQPWQNENNTDHVRCFCNLPPCVLTGYMCKSINGLCFSDFLLDSTIKPTYRGRHGCVEYLTESQRTICRAVSKKIQQIPKSEQLVQKGNSSKSLLVCCQTDMCNHADNPLTRSLLNSTSGDEAVSKLQHQEQEDFLYTNSEVWFRAATIAVPICGAVILLALIALAVKILKSENERSIHHKLGPAMYVVPSDKSNKWTDNPYKPCTFKKPYFPSASSNFPINHPENNAHLCPFQIPLLVADEGRSVYPPQHNECKNDKNAKLLCEANSTKSIILEIEKNTPNFSLAANINSIDNDDEKNYCKNDKNLIV